MQRLIENLNTRFGSKLQSCVLALDEVTIEIDKKDLLDVCKTLRDDRELCFEQIIDLCGVDYLAYGETEWDTEAATEEGFSRGRVHEKSKRHVWKKPRFGVVYHLISYANNQRLRLRTFVEENDLILDSVVDIWNCANWYEREAFDLFGIIFNGHPDLRRILTDYGFIGHPLRKDFPLSGHVEMRYDDKKRRVVYEPVDIEPRILVPKTIRDDNRYLEGLEKES